MRENPTALTVDAETWKEKPVIVPIEVLPGGKMPTKAHETDACWDLYARACDTPSYNVTRFFLGVRLGLPKGWWADIRARSGIWKSSYVLCNGAGVVDAEYRGELMALFYDLDRGAGAESLKPGDRVAQMMIRRVEPVILETVNMVSTDTERGEGGFGSTGR